MGPTKRDVEQVPSLADRIKASNNTPLEPSKRSSNETKPVDRDKLVRNFIRLYCRELAIRPLMIQAVAEARATNLEIINIYGHTEKTSRGNESSEADKIKHNETIFTKGSKSKKQSTRRLKDIENNGKTLAELVNGLSIQNKQECSELNEDTEDADHKTENVFTAQDNNKASNKSLNLNDITGRSLHRSQSDADTNDNLETLSVHDATGDADHKTENVFTAQDNSSKASNKSLNLNDITGRSLHRTQSDADTNDNLETLSVHDATNLVNNDTINSHENISFNDNSHNSVSDLQHNNSIQQHDESFQWIKNPRDDVISRNSSISRKSKRPLVPRYKATLNHTSDCNTNNKTTYTNPVDNLEQSENEIRPFSSSSTATVLPSSETEEGVNYTTEEITSSSQASPDMERKITDNPVPFKLRNTLHTPRAESFPESNSSNKSNGILYKGHRKSEILTENYFSDTPVSRSRKTNHLNQKLNGNKFNKNDINSNRHRIDQVIDGQTRKTLVQNQLKKFGVSGNTRGYQKNGVSSETSNNHNNAITDLNDGFLTMPDKFSPKSDPYHEFPIKLGWFLKSGQLEYDERYTFEDKRQTKSKAYMQVQRQHYKRRTIDVVPQNLNRKIESVRDTKHNSSAYGTSFYNQEPRTPLITKRLRFRKGMVTKPLPKRKPFVTAV